MNMLSKKRRKKCIHREDKTDLIDISDEEGDNLLHLAVVSDIDYQTFKNICRLMSAKYGYFGINCRNNLLQTPLHIASCIGKHSFVEILFDFGADIQLVDRNIENPIHLAVKYGNKSCLEVLLTNSSKNSQILDALNINGLSPLHLCVESGLQYAETFIKMLVEFGADINIRDGLSGRTPLLYALMSRKKESNSLKNTFVSLNSDISLSDYSGFKAIDLMQENDI